jgi:hypothetical protein
MTNHFATEAFETPQELLHASSGAAQVRRPVSVPFYGLSTLQPPPCYWHRSAAAWSSCSALPARRRLDRDLCLEVILGAR